MKEDEMIEGDNNKKKENIKQEKPQKEEKNKDIKKEIPVEQNDEIKKNNEFKVAKTYIVKPKKTFAISICIILLIAVLILSTGFAIINISNQNIVTGILIRGIEVSGLTEAQANQKILQVLEIETKNEINLNVDGEMYSIIPEQFEVKFDVNTATETAYKIGKDSNLFVNNYKILEAMLKKKEIALEISYNEKALEDLLNSINAKLPNAVMDYIYSVEGTELIITKGKPGNAINIEKTKEMIIEKVKAGNYEDIEIEVEYRLPKEIDIEKIYEEVHTEPKNAYFVKEPFELFPHENGIDFDIEEAKEILKEDKEEYVIKLEITKPEILTSDLGAEAFTDLLSSYSTKYNELNAPRTTNVKLATDKINGVIVMPGETFSYNKTLGKRTAAAGYKEADGYAGGRVVPMRGGGICQVSSTLYDAVVYANLEIVERHNHMFVTGYAGAGKDATVSYGTLDFKFKNNRNYPIVIKATAKNGISEVKIYGIKEVEYDVEIDVKILAYTPFKVIYEDDDTLEVGQEKVQQNGANGCKSITYKIVSLNGVEQSREVLSTDTYSPMNKIIKRGTIVVEATEETVETNTEPAKPETEKIPVTPTIKPEDASNTETKPVETPEVIQPEVTPTTPATPSTPTPDVEESVVTPTTPNPETSSPEQDKQEEQEEQTDITTPSNPGGTEGE